MNILTYLQHVKEAIADPKHWIKDTERSGDRMCILGAMREIDRKRVPREYRSTELLQAAHLIQETVREIFPRRVDSEHGTNIDIVTNFNDRKATTHKDVMRVLDRTIEKQEAKKMWSELRRKTKRVPRQPEQEKQEEVHAIR